jgi:putative molybdopterin biosynthesis protein
MTRWRPELRLAWHWDGPDGRDADPRLPALLAAVAATGSLRGAARAAGLSYRHAWSLLQPWATPAPNALVAMHRGHGAALTPEGLALLRLDRDGQAALRELRPGLAVLAAGSGNAADIRYACEASHDLALAALPECALGHHLQLALTFRGSADALAALAAGRCALAGFHVPAAVAHPLRRSLLSPFAGQRGIGIVPVLERTQGLIVGKRNPRHLATLADLTRRGVRFVNRQRGAGTRLLFDALIAEAGIAPKAIAGYDNEEFTHAAVAATVAAGGAHAGFGIAAAAAQFGLPFLPLAQETYALAFNGDVFPASAQRALLATLRGAKWRAVVGGMPGYRAPSRPSIRSLATFLR